MKSQRSERLMITKNKSKFKQTEIGELEKKLEKIKTFRELINYFYNIFPNGLLSEDKINKIIVTEDVRKSLVEKRFLLREKLVSNKKYRFYYSLGPNSLSLVSSWKTEELTRSIKKLTWIAVVMTGISTILIIIQILKVFGAI